jgi:hypothetical protein
MSTACQAGSPPQAEQSRQCVLEALAGSAGRIGHDLLGLAMPLRAVLESAAEDGVEVAGGPEACRMIERIGAGLQMLAAGERMSATAEIGAVWETIEPLVKATLPRGVVVDWRLEGSQTVRAGREAVAQAIFRCCHAVAAWSGPGSKVVVRGGAGGDSNASAELRFELEKPAQAEPGGGLAMLPRHDDAVIAAMGATIEARPADPGLALVLTVPVV